MNQKEIHDLIKLINKTDISEFKLKDKEFSLSIRTSQYKGNSGEVNVVPVMQAAPQTIHSAPTPAAPAASVTPPAVEKSSNTDEPKSETDTSSSGNYEVFKSPMVGTFYRKPSPDKEVFVQVGDKVKKGDVLCVIEAMKLFNEVECEMDGTIVKVLLDDASPVEYDQALFHIEPA